MPAVPVRDPLPELLLLLLLLLERVEREEEDEEEEEEEEEEVKDGVEGEGLTIVGSEGEGLESFCLSNTVSDSLSECL